MTVHPQVQQLLEDRRRVLRQTVGRSLPIPAGTAGEPLTSERADHLFGELEDLYWNDLEWENVTEEERMEGGALPELTFPGVLALVRALLQTERAPDSGAPPEPRPEVVERFLAFLARRVVECRDRASGGPSDDGDRAALDGRMTEGLLDRVLLEYHRLSPEEVGTLDEG